jgi:integrase
MAKLCWARMAVVADTEVLGLRWRDLDLTAGVLQVRRQLQRDKTYSTPKAKSRRRIDLAAPEIQALQAHRALQQADRLAYGAAYEEQELVFCTHRGRPLSWRNVTREFKKHLVAAGLRNIRFHDLRHTNATLLLEAGVHPKVVQERLGHSDIGTTLNIYSHVMPTLGRDAAQHLRDILHGDEATDTRDSTATQAGDDGRAAPEDTPPAR